MRWWAVGLLLLSGCTATEPQGEPRFDVLFTIEASAYSKSVECQGPGTTARVVEDWTPGQTVGLLVVVDGSTWTGVCRTVRQNLPANGAARSLGFSTYDQVEDEWNVTVARAGARPPCLASRPLECANHFVIDTNLHHHRRGSVPLSGPLDVTAALEPADSGHMQAVLFAFREGEPIPFAGRIDVTLDGVAWASQSFNATSFTSDQYGDPYLVLPLELAEGTPEGPHVLAAIIHEGTQPVKTLGGVDVWVRNGPEVHGLFSHGGEATSVSLRSVAGNPLATRIVPTAPAGEAKMHTLSAKGELLIERATKPCEILASYQAYEVAATVNFTLRPGDAFVDVDQAGVQAGDRVRVSSRLAGGSKWLGPDEGTWLDGRNATGEQYWADIHNLHVLAERPYDARDPFKMTVWFSPQVQSDKLPTNAQLSLVVTDYSRSVVYWEGGYDLSLAKDMRYTCSPRIEIDQRLPAEDGLYLDVTAVLPNGDVLTDRSPFI